MGLIKKRPRVRVSAPKVLIPGESFEAVVIVEADKPVPVNAITVSFIGVEEATVGTSDGSTTRRRRIVDMIGELAGRGELDAGVRSYPFQFVLPKDAPPSFEAKVAGSMVAFVLYTYEVHIDIPWWPDRHAMYEAKVGFTEQPEPRAQSVLAASSPGPKGNEGYVELSLATDVFGQGEEITGAIALGNRGRVRYESLEIALVSTCTREIGGHRDSDETGRHVSRLRIPEGNESLTFARRLPEKVFPSMASKHWRVSWALEITASVTGGPDAVVTVPVHVVPSQSSSSRRRLAPPVVGRKRVDGIWREVAQQHGLALEDSVLHARAGECEVTVSRESNARGNLIVAELTYPSLRLGLSMRARLLKRREIAGRDAGQTAWFVSQLPDYIGIDVEAADDRLRLIQPGSGQDPDQLGEFVTAALRFAEAMPRPDEVPPAESAKPWLPKWREVSNVLEGTLMLADLSTSGRLGGCDVELWHEWPKRGRAKTLMSARPPGPLKTPNVELSWVALGADAAPLRERGAKLRTLDDRLVLESTLQLDPTPLLPKLRVLAKLARGLTS